MSCRLFCAVAIVSAVAVSTATAAELEVAEAAEVAALASDDECHTGALGDCSLNALQFRAREATMAEGPGASTVEDAVFSDDQAPGPGDSGDLSAFNDTGADLEATYGSCASYGCGGFSKAHSCQCNSHCEHYGNCCGDYHSKCSRGHGGDSSHHHHGTSGRVVTGYHQTSAAAGRAILRSGFRSGHVGYCGGGIYFAASVWATSAKAIGPDSKHGFIIEAKIDLGRNRHMKNVCLSSRLGVKSLSHTPTSRYLARMHADSFTFNPCDGTEYVIADPRRVISMKKYQRR